MAEHLDNIRSRLSTLKDTRKSTLEKLLAVEELRDGFQDGFSTRALELIFTSLSSIKVSLRLALVESCLPAGAVSHSTVDSAVFLMTRRSAGILTKKMLLEWLRAGVEHFFEPDVCKYLRTYYGPIFLQTEYRATMNLACSLLLPLTELSDVQPHRVDALLALTSPDFAATSGPLWSLISKYRLLRPDMVQRCVYPSGQRWNRPMGKLQANIERWQQRREHLPAAGAGADGDLWDMGRQKMTRRAQATAVALLPESAPAAGVEQRRRQQGRRELTSLSSREEALAQATHGFRDAHHVTAMLLTRERRALIMLAGNVELTVAKANMDLVVLMRTMFVYEPHLYSDQQRQHLTRQLLVSQQLGLPLGAARGLARHLLASARPGQPGRWLPALDLLPFYGWRPFGVLHEELLKPLLALAQLSDWHVRLHLVHVLTEYVVRLARDELPLVCRRVFPYTSPVLLDEVASSRNPAVDVGRVADHVAGMCHQLSAPSLGRTNLLRATLDFCTRVSPVLLDSGVPVVLHIRRDVVFQVLLGSDVLALNKLLLMFAQYRQLSPRLSRIRAPKLVALMARHSSQALEAATDVVHDALRLLFGRRRGELCARLPAAAAAAVRALAEDAFLPNHPACLSYQLLQDRTEVAEDVAAPALETLLAADGLVGFTEFSGVY